MDQVDSLNEMGLQSTPMTSVSVSVSNVANTSQVIAVAADLPSFQYFISEQAKSILALQELQNEVGALLEFRDLVMEAFPQLGQKVQNMQLQNAISSAKWEPGIRVKRKLGQQLRGDTDMLVPSLLPRLRSNSQGKSSRRGEMSGSATSSSAIQDSGFCTESSKDNLSVLSSRSKSRDAADELFSLLDNIHNKGTRLKLEVEYLWNRLNRKEAGCASLNSTSVRRCKSLDDLMLANRSQSFTFEYAVKTAFLESELTALKQERDTLLKKLGNIEGEHMANQAQTNRLLIELETMSSEKRELEERLQMAIHSENDVNGRINNLHANFLMRNQWRNVQTPFAKCQLLKLEQVFKGTTQTATNAISGSNNARLPDAGAAHAMYTSAAAKEDYPKVEYSRAELGAKVARPVNPVTKELMNDATSYRVEEKVEPPDATPAATCTPTTITSATSATTSATSAVTLTSTKEFGDAVDYKLLDGTSLGKPDVLIGFVSGHPSSFDSATTKRAGGVTLSKEKVLSILNEYDPKTLHCFLLTLSYQVEALNVHMQRISKSRMNIFKQLNKYKFENEDLKLELKKKEIELEGTKAQKRVLEQKCSNDVKHSYSTSDLMMTSMSKSRASPDSRAGAATYACSISDSALVMSDHRTSTPLASRCGALGTLGSGSAKCTNFSTDSNDRSVRSAVVGGSNTNRRSYSKIPLKTYSNRAPSRLSSGSKKSLTSFKEYSSTTGLPHSSCISSTSSSLNHK